MLACTVPLIPTRTNSLRGAPLSYPMGEERKIRWWSPILMLHQQRSGAGDTTSFPPVAVERHNNNVRVQLRFEPLRAASLTSPEFLRNVCGMG
jgi:hypothetical protein